MTNGPDLRKSPPTKDTPRGRPVHDWSDIYSLKVLKNEKYRFVKEQLVVDFELLN